MPDEITKPKRKSRPKPQPSNLANSEIDKRLAQAIIDRAQAMKMCSKLAYWQDRLQRVSAEIDSLISFQQRLAGHAVITGPQFVEKQLNLSTGTEQPATATMFSHLADISSVSSIPARQPKPTTPNVADVVGGEGGFS